jgi:hypothetical protein
VKHGRYWNASHHREQPDMLALMQLTERVAERHLDRELSSGCGTGNSRVGSICQVERSQKQPSVAQLLASSYLTLSARGCMLFHTQIGRSNNRP